MPHQPSFARVDFGARKRVTRREQFLARMKESIRSAKLLAVIGPHYPTGEWVCPPVGLERMLRVYFLPQWYGLEDAIYDKQSLWSFARLDLAEGKVPDATTLLKPKMEASLRRNKTNRQCGSVYQPGRASFAPENLLFYA
jgi:IS5 family transposase